MSRYLHTANVRIASFIFVFFIIFISGAEQSNAIVRLFGEVTSDNHNVSFAKVLAISDGDTLSYLTDKDGWYSVIVSELPVITNVSAESKDIPTPFTLSQNYPNPFNPSTIIEYELTASAHVNLTIFNILGQKIRSLVNESKSPGNHSIIWNGRDNNGNFSASGIYIYRIIVSGSVQSKKMLLLDSGGGRSPSLSPIMLKPSAASKTTVESNLEYELVIMKDGYETFREFITSPTEPHETRKDISLTSTIITENTEDYFPLNVGNSWTYLDEACASDSTTEKYVSEWSASITGTREIDGKTFYIFNRWPRFIPSILHDDNMEPLVRSNQSGDFILRYHDVELTLYKFSEPEEFNIGYELDEYFSENSQYYNENPELLERFIDIEIILDSWERLHLVNGISGIYEECRLVEMRTEKNNATISESDVFFSQHIGPISYVSISEEERSAPLKNAIIDNDNYGVPSGIALSGTLTDADIEAILNLTIEEWFSRSYSDINGYLGYSDIIVSNENIPDTSSIKIPISGMTFTYMDYEAIIEKARTEGKFMFLQISKFEVSEDVVTTEIAWRVTPIDCFLFGDCAGQGMEVVFRPIFGAWFIENVYGWIAD
ncbi:T9SS type A sorting domain-containing protein [Candidatus Latescibacterota bacterium]